MLFTFFSNMPKCRHCRDVPIYHIMTSPFFKELFDNSSDLSMHQKSELMTV